MAEQNPGFGETNTPERAGGIVRDHVRAVIESAEGNAAEIRRRAREDAEALDQERADSASRLTTQLGELEGSFTNFGERLGKEVLPSGEIKGELGSGAEGGGGAASATEPSPGRTGSATAWRAPADSAPAPSDAADAPEGEASVGESEGLIGGLKKRFSSAGSDAETETAAEPDADAEGSEPDLEAEAAQNEPAAEQETSEADAAPPPTSQASSDWVPGGSEGAAVATSQPDDDFSDAGGSDTGVSWAPSAASQTPPEPAAPADSEERPETGSEPAQAAEPASSTPDPSGTPPRGRIARLLLGRRPGE